MTPYISAADVESRLHWHEVVECLVEGHRLERAAIEDSLLTRGGDSILSRAAWVPGLALGVKTATIFPRNASRQPPLATVNAIVALFDDRTGVAVALVDGALVTKWKTAGDSVLGARYLARPDSRRLLVVGAGAVADSVVRAYSEIFPDLEEIRIWSRNGARAAGFAGRYARHAIRVVATDDLAGSAHRADIVVTATMSRAPILLGDWLRPGTHVDLIGAFRPDMREADDTLVRRASIFVDARETTLRDIGELSIPIREGVISESDIKADLYELCRGARGRSDSGEITAFKNGGGAHLDVMTAWHILEKYRAGQ